MKIVVKQESWWSNKQGGIEKNEITSDYPEAFLFVGAKTVVDYTERESIVEKKGLFGRVKFRERKLFQDAKFGFVVVDKRENEIDLEIFGGPFYFENDEAKNKIKTNAITLKLNESKSYNIQMFDAGDTYTIILLKD